MLKLKGVDLGRNVQGPVELFRPTTDIKNCIYLCMSYVIYQISIYVICHKTYIYICYISNHMYIIYIYIIQNIFGRIHKVVDSCIISTMGNSVYSRSEVVNLFKVLEIYQDFVCLFRSFGQSIPKNHTSFGQQSWAEHDSRTFQENYLLLVCMFGWPKVKKSQKW